MTWAGVEHTHSGEPSDARKQRAPNEPAKQTRRSINADLDAVPWGRPWSHFRGGNCLWRLRRGRHLVGRHRHGREFNPLRALLGLIMDDQSTTVCPLPSLFLGLKIAVRQGHRTPKGTMLRGAVLHCQFEREAKGGPPQRVGGSMPNTKHCPTLGFSGMSRVVLSVQFLRTKALLSLDHGAAGGAVWYRTNSAATMVLQYGIPALAS